MSIKKKRIPWHIENLDFKKYNVSKMALKEIEKLQELPLILIPIEATI